MDKTTSLPQRIYRHTLLLQAHDEFMSDILKLRKRGEEIIEIIEMEDMELPIRYEDTSEFNEDIEKLRNEYGLSKIYHLPLTLFVKTGKLHEILTKDRVVKVEKMPDDYEMMEDVPISQKIAIEIFPETTLKDIVRNWKEIVKERDILYKTRNRKMERFSQRDNLERDLEILRLRNEGKTAKEISQIIREEISFKNRIVGYEEIPKIIQRLKQRAKDSLPNKEI